MLEVLREERLEALVKINIDEGGGGEIIEKFALLTHFETGSIAPMFYLILPPPQKTNP